MRSHLSLSALALLGLCFSCSADDSHPAIKQAREVRRLTSEVVKELTKLAVDESDHSLGREHAIMTLGELKASDSIEPLLRILLTKGMLRSEIGPLAGYPAARALAGMGSVIYREVWDKIADDPSDEYLYVLAFTMVGVDDQPIATLRVKEQMKKTTYAPLLQNYRRLLALLETTNFRDIKQWPK
jgi:hypothetical protein